MREAPMFVMQVDGKTEDLWSVPYSDDPKDIALGYALAARYARERCDGSGAHLIGAVREIIRRGKCGMVEEGFFRGLAMLATSAAPGAIENVTHQMDWHLFSDMNDLAAMQRRARRAAQTRTGRRQPSLDRGDASKARAKMNERGRAA